MVTFMWDVWDVLVPIMVLGQTASYCANILNILVCVHNVRRLTNSEITKPFQL